MDTPWIIAFSVAVLDVLLTASMLPTVWRVRKRIRHRVLPAEADPEQQEGG